MIERPRIKNKARRSVSKTAELLKGLAIFILIAVILRIFLVGPFKVSGDSMNKSLYTGDYLLISKISYWNSKPSPGDLVQFEHPFHTGVDLVSRIIATEGQIVQISGKTVLVNGEQLKEKPTVSFSDYRILPADFSNRDYMQTQLVPPGHIFVLGDNRDSAEDSRQFGFVKNESIKGKALFVYFSWAPDPNAPKMESPYITPALQIFFYNLIHFSQRIRWDRLFTSS